MTDDWVEDHMKDVTVAAARLILRGYSQHLTACQFETSLREMSVTSLV